MVISFAWTAPALVAGHKTMTRRDWSPGHAAKFHAGDLVDAYDKSPRAGGRKVAALRLTKDPYLQSTARCTRDDYEREGFRWLAEHGHGAIVALIWRQWTGPTATVLWVVEFRLVSVEGSTVRTANGSRLAPEGDSDQNLYTANNGRSNA